MRTPSWKWMLVVGAGLMASSCSDPSDGVTAANRAASQAAAMPSVNAAPRPFKGSVAGETYWKWSDVCLPAQPVRTYTAMAGELPHLGRATVETEHCSSADGQSVANGQVVFTAANGDQLFGTYDGHVTTKPPPVLVGEYTITFNGGTGRFQHATGSTSMIVRFTTIPLPPTIESRWPGEVRYDGTISY